MRNQDGILADCNADGIPDDCESDCDANGIPDDCEEDQDGDGVPDACDDDVDGDGVPNECDIDTSTQSPYANATYWDPADGGNGHWYAYVEFEKGCLEETSAQAQALGGHLATITSQDENDFVDSLVPGTALTGVRLGGFQAPGNMDPSAGWNWVTGESWSYTDWSTGGLPQPDDIKGDESWLRLLPTSIYGDAMVVGTTLLRLNVTLAVQQTRLSPGWLNGLCWIATTMGSRTNVILIQMETRFPTTVMMTQTTMAFLTNVTLICLIKPSTRALCLQRNWRRLHFHRSQCPAKSILGNDN